VGDKIDIVNVMAYDAGQDWAENQYKTAMYNYYNLVGAKAVLGLDNQNQWPGFSESDDQLVAKAKWAYEDDKVFGTFLWTIGGAGDNLDLLTRVAEHYKGTAVDDDSD